MSCSKLGVNMRNQPNMFSFGVLSGLLLISVLWGAMSHAARLEKAGDNKVVYIAVESGKQVDALEADKLTTLDKPVLSCKAVEKVCSERTGKCSIKTVH